MTSPKRLIEDGTSFDRRLLHASRTDRPSPNFEDRVIAAAGLASPARTATRPPSWLVSRLPFVILLAIGIAPVVVVSIAGAGRDQATIAIPPSLAQRAVTQGVSAPNPEDESASETTGDSSRGAKSFVGVDDSVNQVLVAGETPTQDREPPPSKTSGVRRIPTTPAVPNTAHALPAASSVPAGTAAHGPETRAPAETAVVTEADGDASLHREVELLDAVKQHLRSGAALAAERGLGAYDAEFPHGTLKPEAGLLRVRVLVAKGDRDGARRLGDELLRHHPNGVFERRIRTALGSTDGEAAPHASPR